MALSKTRDDSTFALTAGARKVAEKAKEQATGGETLPEPDVREVDDHPYTIRFWKDQADLIFELRYRTRNSFNVTDLARRAVDEYLIAHADELMVTPEEAARLESRRKTR